MSNNTKNNDATDTDRDNNQSYDDLIGSFGKYQFLIFMFKILIGVTSAFNNLGVTFFAPSDFISFWCADTQLIPNQTAVATTTILPSTIQTFSLPLEASNTILNSTQFYSTASFHQIPHAESYISNQTLFGAHSVEPPSSNNAIGHLFTEFMFSSERKQRHNLLMKHENNYDTPTNLRKECKFLSPIDNQYHKCTSYKYDTGIWMSTIVDEWNLVCDRSWFISVTQSLYMAGFIISFLMFGYLSDRFGRWNSLLIGASIEVMSGFGCAFASSITAFMVFRCLVGLGSAGRSSSAYLIMIEWTGGSWRMHISTLGSLGWIFGYCVMPWITLFFLHFRHMQMFVCFYEIIFIVWLLRLPESPRWLLAHRKFDEAYNVLLMAAKFNGLIIEDNNDSKSSHHQERELSSTSLSYATALSDITANGGENKQQAKNGTTTATTTTTTVKSAPPPSIDIEGTNKHATSNGSTIFNCHRQLTRLFQVDQLKPYTMDEFDRRFKRLSSTIESKEFTKKEHRLSIFDLFKWKNLRKYTLILAFAWAVNSFVYYGIALNVGKFGAKNLFIAFTYAGITELPAIAFTIICMKFLPRKTTNIFLFSTIFLLCALQVPLKYYNLQWLQQATMLMAKLFNSCSFTCILYQSVELFPTSIRQTAYSSCALAGRIGSILAPFIKELSQKTNNLVPPIIYAALSIAEIVLIRNLPETQGVELPDTLLEAEKFRGTDKKGSSEQDLASAQISPPPEMVIPQIANIHTRRRSSFAITKDTREE